MKTAIELVWPRTTLATAIFQYNVFAVLGFIEIGTDKYVIAMNEHRHQDTDACVWGKILDEIGKCTTTRATVCLAKTILATTKPRRLYTREFAGYAREAYH